MSDYSSELNLKEALTSFFKKYDLGEDGGLNKPWAKLKVGNFYIPFPNTAERKRALMFHDIHHIVTGYKSNWQGEAEISAWEVASGCGDYRAAWILDLGGMFMGLFFFPKKTFKAFIRGRRTLNLYHKTYSRDELEGMKISEVRAKLKLDQADTATATSKDVYAFIGWILIASLMWGVPFLVFYGLIIWWLIH